jgi:hypothetical protein
MSVKKPIPLVVSPTRRLCPICGQPSYSSIGIHPQCAVSQADAPRCEILAAERKARAQQRSETMDNVKPSTPVRYGR